MTLDLSLSSILAPCVNLLQKSLRCIYGMWDLLHHISGRCFLLESFTVHMKGSAIHILMCGHSDLSVLLIQEKRNVI